MPRIRSTSLYGTLNLLILKAVADEPRHGLGIARRIHRVTEDVLKVEEGALYPALHRLEADGLLEASWGVSENNRRAKFYALTSRGREHLEREMTGWVEHIRAVARLLDVPLTDVAGASDAR